MLNGVFNKKLSPTPTIKGLFVTSHIEALRKKLGPDGLQKLRHKTGKTLSFKSFEAVPVSEEVEILENAVDLLSGEKASRSERSLAAGRLHFNNFAKTTLGSALLYSLPRTQESFITLLHNIPSVARIVFSGITFRVDYGRGCRIVCIDNCEYPLEHFQGFFEEWLTSWSLKHEPVHAEAQAPKTFCYTLRF